MLSFKQLNEYKINIKLQIIIYNIDLYVVHFVIYYFL